MSRPSRIKTSKDAYDEGFQVGRHPNTAGAWPEQSDFNTTPRDPLVDAWTRGWSDGNKEREGSRVPLWATNPPRKTMKRRKYKRTARHGGRVMTVTTSSRVVKTTRMNPRKRYRSDREMLGAFVRDFVRMSRGRKPTEQERRHALTLMGLGGSPNVTAQQILRERSNPEDMISGSKRIAELMSPWHSSGSDPIYAVSSHWDGGLAVARRSVEGALANIDRDVALAETAAGRERNGWTKTDLRQLKTIRNYLRKSLGSKSNPRPSKTHIEYVIQGNYGYGWDDENTELTRADAKRSLGEYRANGQGSYRLIRRRVKNDATNPHDPRTAPTVRIPAVIRASIPALSGDPRHAETRRLRVVRVGARSNPSQGGGYWALARVSLDGDLAYLVGPASRTPRTSRDPQHATKYGISDGIIREHLRLLPKIAKALRWRIVRLAATNPQLALKLSAATWRRLPKRDRRARGSIRFVRCKTSKRGAAHWLRCVVR